jgi:NAD(P)-dependent dehydrogenase (short-subunit alcohol dehydrogenase family)
MRCKARDQSVCRLRPGFRLARVELTSAKRDGLQVLDDRVVVITGASSGLGVQLAHAVAQAGGTPVLAARRAERLEALSHEIPNADPVVCDVTDEADRERLVDGVMERHGRLDGLINNAGSGAMATALRTSTETFVRILNLNLVAPFALSCLAAGRMREGGGGSIVNIASVMGLRSVGQFPDAAYVASKAGILGLTRELASQWGRHGIRVNAVAPGFFASEMTAGMGDDPEQFPEFLLTRTPLGRGGREGELNDAVLFLLGPGSSFVTGTALSVDGGMASA